jgi:hypothetical protein
MAVATEEVSLLDDAPYSVRVGACPPSLDEERRRHASVTEQVEQHQSIFLRVGGRVIGMLGVNGDRHLHMGMIARGLPLGAGVAASAVPADDLMWRIAGVSSSSASRQLTTAAYTAQFA